MATKKKKPLPYAWAGGRQNSIASGVARATKPQPYGATLAAPGPSPAAAPASPKFDFSNLPVDPVYDQVVGSATKTRDDTYAGLDGEKTRTLADYGYSAAYDDKGNATSFTVDPSNPFSRAALLKKNYEQSKTGTTNGLAARGQLYSGAMANAQNSNDSNFLQGDNALKSNLGSILAGILSRRGAAGTDYETTVGTAYGDRVGRAQSSPLYSPTSDPAAGPAAAPAASKAAQWAAQPYTVQPGKNSKGQAGVWHTYNDGSGRRVFVVGGTR